MTPAMLDLLKRLVANERRFLLQMESYHNNGEHISDYPENDSRGEEIGWSVNARTVGALEKLGLVETVQVTTTRSLVFLGSYRWDKSAGELFE